MTEFKHGHEEAVYDLFGIVHHMGSLHRGHYTASCINPVSGEWEYCDDDDVSPCADKQLIDDTSYVLFYRLRG